MPETLTAVLTAGLHWLYETEQPDNALASHHGLILRVPQTNRLYSFITADHRRRMPMIAVDVASIEWIDNGPNELPTPANPLEPGELEALAAALRALGFEVTSTWNGHPQTSGSVGLARPAHPSLVAAVGRYHGGCLDHPGRSVFCECESWSAGFRRVVKPHAPACTAGLLPHGSGPVDRCVVRGPHDDHRTAAGARWTDADSEVR